MKNFILALSVSVLAGNMAFAQNATKYEKLYYKDIKQETDQVTITVDNAISTAGETKFKLKITNKTNDYLIYKPEESKFVVNGKEMQAKEKWLIIKPNASEFRVINLKGPGYNEVKSYSFILDGLYTVSMNGSEVKAPDFRLPPSVNEFSAGDFKCTLVSSSKETDKTEAKFKCAYSGSKVGIIQPAKAAVKMPDGQEYANAKKGKEILLMKGEDESFTMGWERMQGGKQMDMQKVEMLIIWRATLSESELVKLKEINLSLEFDEALTQAKK